MKNPLSLQNTGEVHRLSRGGNWFYREKYLRTHRDFYFHSFNSESIIGFRLCRTQEKA